jgi:hypothetical protein
MKKKIDKILEIIDYGEKILPALLSISILIYGAYYILNKCLQDRELLFSDDSNILVIETKYPLGSIFNKDAIEITANAIIFYEKNLFQSKEISLPYNKIERIVFTDGLFWDSIKIETHGFLSKNYKIYFRDDETRTKLKAFIGVFDLEIVEQSTILKYLDQQKK